MDGIDFQSSEPESSNESMELDFVPFEEKQKVQQPPSRLRSLIGAAPKGFLTELQSQLMKTPILGSRLKKAQRENPELFKSEEDFSRELEKYLPTQEGFAEKALERGGKIAPYAITGGGNVLGQALRSAVAGFLGEVAKESGLPPWAQSLAELPAFAAPSLGKKIIPTAAQKELVEGGRRLGLSEEAITPLIQSEMKKKWLTKFSPKRGRTQEALKKSKSGLGNIYGALENSEVAKSALTTEQSQEVLESIEGVMEKLPSGVRNKIKQDLSDLLNAPITGSSLINFFKDINHYIGKGEQKLGLLKGPIGDALKKLSPQLGEDFSITNRLYSEYAQMAGRLKPTLVGDLMSAGRAVRTMLGVTTGNYPLLAEAIGESAAKRIAREMLINPRLQNLSKKMVSALNQNKSAIANRILKDYTKEISEIDPELGDDFNDIDFKILLPSRRS